MKRLVGKGGTCSNSSKSIGRFTRTNSQKRIGGFTIAEVSIASGVFAVILLIAIAIFFGISKLFYKGVSVTQTQEVTQQIYQEVAGSFQNASSITIPSGKPNGYSFYCVGNTRYTYILNNEVNLDNTPNHSPYYSDGSGGNYGLLKDNLSGGGSACAAPCSDTGTTVCTPPAYAKLQSPTELLGQKMRLSKFNITQSSTNRNLYNISMTIAYGDDSVLNLTDVTNPSCNGGGHGTEFCSVNKVDTSVYKGFSF